MRYNDIDHMGYEEDLASDAPNNDGSTIVNDK